MKNGIKVNKLNSLLYNRLTLHFYIYGSLVDDDFRDQGYFYPTGSECYYV